MNPEGHETSLEDLFVAALAVLNRALDAHRGSTPYRQIFAECAEQLQDRRLGAQLYVDNPSQPVTHFAVRFHNGLFEPVFADGPVGVPVWKISVDQLKEIVAAEDQYVSNPGRLPWDWLATWIRGGKELISKC